MRGRGLRVLLAVAACAVAASTGVAAAGPPPAPEARGGRAAVTVDFGDGRVVTRVVTFAGSSIAGIDALRATGFEIHDQGYGTLGVAVCGIADTGCAPGSGCLDCQQPKYWAYFHNGTYSPRGAGGVTLRDGDQDQWKWGTGGSAPPTTAWPTTTSTTTAPSPTRPPTTVPAPATSAPQRPPTTAAAAPTAPPDGGGTTAPRPAAVTTTTASPTTTPSDRVDGSTTSTTAPASTTTTTTTVAVAADGDAPGPGAVEDASSARPVDPPARGAEAGGAGGGSAPVVSLVGFGAVMAGFGVLFLRARARRG